MAVFDALESSLSLDKSKYTRGLKSAAKETVAFGSVAEGTFDDVGDEAAEAGSEAAASSAGFEELADAVGDTAIPARLAASSLDDAGDEATEAGAEAATASTGFGALRISTTGLSFSLGMLTTVGTSTTVMLGALTVAVGALLTALLPVAIGAAAVATAFGVIVGSGIYAGMSELQETFASVRQEIEPLVRELGEQFVPFLKETIQMLPGLVKSLLDAIGPLDQFLGALRTLRNVAFALLPQFIQWFIDLGRWAIPVLRGIGNWIVDSLAPALRSLIERGKSLWNTFERLAPTFGTILDTVRRLWTWMQSLVQEFKNSAENGTSLRETVNQLVRAAKRFWQNLQPVIDALKPFVEELVRAAPAVAQTAIDVGRLAINLGTKLLPYLIPIINALTRVVQWFNSLSGGVQKAILIVGGFVAAIGPIISVATTIIGVLGTFVSVLGTVGTALVTVVTFFNPITLAIAALVAAAVGLYVAFENNFLGIRDIANDVLDTVTTMLSDAASWVQSTGASLWDDSFGALADAAIAAYNAIMPDSLGLPEIEIPRVELSIPGLEVAGQQVYEAQSVGVGPFGPFGGQSVGIPQLASGGFIESEGLAMLHEGEQVVPAAQVDKGSTGTQQQVEVVLSVDGDGELASMIERHIDANDAQKQSTYNSGMTDRTDMI